MKKFVIAAVLGAATLTGAAHAGQQDGSAAHRPGGMAMMAMIDADKDGVITRAEAIAAADRLFDRIDRNRDGKLDKDELRPPHRRGSGAPDAKSPPPGAVAPLQTDRDGRIDKPARGSRAGAMRGGMLARADANQDGAIDRAEFRAAALARFDRADANHDGRIDAAERAAMHDRKGPARQGDGTN